MAYWHNSIWRWGRVRMKQAARDQSGSTAVEFSFVVIPLIALILAIIETAIISFSQGCLETATERAARSVATGIPQKAGYSASTFKTETCKGLAPMLSCSNLVVDVQSSVTLAGLPSASPGPGPALPAGQYTPGGPGAFVRVRLMYVWNLPGMPAGFDFSNFGARQRLLIATLINKTEPYNL